MNLNQLIISKAKASRLYNVNNPKVIKEILLIPDYIDIKKVNKIMDSSFEVYYLKKDERNKKQTTVERRQSFIAVNKYKYPMLNSIPNNENVFEYRRILSLQEEWMKKSHRKFNKILTNILLSKKEKGKIKVSEIPYLHSSVKKRSYSTNAKEHVGYKYVFSVDLKDFYPSVTREKIYIFFRNYFNLDSDIATFYSFFSTYKDEKGNYVLAQGLSQSSVLAYLVNNTLFNYIYNEAIKINLTMSLYVDDIVFSSTKPIPQDFINKLFGLFKRNGMQIKRKKVHYISNTGVKKITGVYVKGNKTRVSNRKHEEFEFQYNYLKKKIVLINTIADYFECYNIYLRFYGNYQNIKLVENKVNCKYEEFINEFDVFFPKGINKKNRTDSYTIKNIKRDEDLVKLNSCFQKLKE